MNFSFLNQETKARAAKDHGKKFRSKLAPETRGALQLRLYGGVRTHYWEIDPFAD